MEKYRLSAVEQKLMSTLLKNAETSGISYSMSELKFVIRYLLGTRLMPWLICVVVRVASTNSSHNGSKQTIAISTQQI